MDLTDNQQLDELSKEIYQEDRELLIEALKDDLAKPQPEDLEGKAKVVTGRANTIGQIRRLNSDLKTFDAASLIGHQLIDRKWLLYPLLPSAEVTLCTGEGGFGKSYLSLQIACLLTAGFNHGALTKADIHAMTPYHYFLQPQRYDFDYAEPSPVVYAGYEDNLDEINRRILNIFGRFDFAESKQPRNPCKLSPRPDAPPRSHLGTGLGQAYPDPQPSHRCRAPVTKNLQGQRSQASHH